MHLTAPDERILAGEQGYVMQKAMEILVALGDIYGADRLIPVKSTQIAGVSYKTIGDAGLEWISDLSGAVRVPSILNPAGIDRLRWRELGVSEEFAAKQEQIIDAYEKLGIIAECTCTPYHLRGDIAEIGDHLAWSESSAVSYANSVIGARTNREGGPSALAAALIGKTPNYGYHLDENRVPSLEISVEGKLSGTDYGALGYIAGRIAGARVPVFSLESVPTDDERKALGAAMAASGAVALYYIEGLPPHPPGGKCDTRDIGERVTIEQSKIAGVYDLHRCDPDIIALGCPHCSADELLELRDLLAGKTVTKEFWICTSRALRDRHPDIVAGIESSGAKVICDTCMVVSPMCTQYDCMMVASGKALAYVPQMCGTDAVLGRIEDCVRAAVGGE
ncbi:MAG: aconitase X catalytic domain-containing protein [Euryarchaeota archaeon]|nr:aconitase X catalytic domain-containing protein [Euryarchaeota archaeon]